MRRGVWSVMNGPRKPSGTWSVSNFEGMERKQMGPTEKGGGLEKMGLEDGWA